MSPAEQILAALGGGLQGANETYWKQRKFEQDDRAIDSRTEIARLQGELRLMFEQLRSAGSAQRNQDSIEGRLEQERIRQGGADARNDADNATTVATAGMRDETARRGQDLSQQLGLVRDATTRRGQDLNFTLGEQRNTTTRRGQDITRQLGLRREQGLDARATTAAHLRREEMKSREQIAAGRNRNPWESITFDTPSDVEPGEVTKPTATPIEVLETPLPNTGTGTRRSPEAAIDQTAQLEQQARSLLAQFQKEADPAKKAALRAQLKRLRDRIAAAQQKGL